MSRHIANIGKKFASTFLTISVTLWSLGLSLGLSLLPRVALALGPVPTFGGPPAGQTSVPTDAPVDREFDKALDSATVTTSTVLLQTNTGNTETGSPTGSNLCSSVSLGADGAGNANRKITCNHATLSTDTWYTFTIKGSSTGLKDTDGEALQFDFMSSFQTGNFDSGSFTGIIPPPRVMGSLPNPGGTVPVNGKIVVNFEPGGNDPQLDTMLTSGTGSIVSPDNVQLFDESATGGTSGSNKLVASELFWDAVNKRLIVTPGSGKMTASNRYIFIVKSTAQNTDNIGLEGGIDYFVPFSATAADTAGPTVTGTYPDNNTTNIDRVTTHIGIMFDETIDEATVSSSTVQLIVDSNGNGTLDNPPTDNPITNIQIQVEGDGRSVVLSPLLIMASSTKHFIRVVGGASGVKDAIGNAMAADVVKNFTTGTLINGVSTDTTQPSVNFAEADSAHVEISFSEAMKASGSNSAADIANFTLESPQGTSVSLAGKFIQYEAMSRITRIHGLQLLPGNSFKITVATSTQDLSGNTMKTGGANAGSGTVKNPQLATGPMPGGGGFQPGGTMVMPERGVAGATTRYRAELNITTGVPSGGKIVVTFPSGFSFVADGGTTECQDKFASFENDDINGPGPGAITFTVACDNTAQTVTLTTSGGALNANDYVRFMIQGVKNSTQPKDFTSTGYTATVKTFDTSNTLLESKTSMPFFLTTPGTQSIAGTVYNDTNKNNAKDAGETGVNAITVCMGGMVGFECTQTAADGTYSFTGLNDGFYHVEVPPITSASIDAVGGFMWQDVNLSGGSNKTDVNFGLKPADGIITVSITGGPANKVVDAFGYNPTDSQNGGSVVREVTLDASGAGSASLPVSFGTWEVVVGPSMPKGMGSMSAPPEFDFVPPRPTSVVVTSTNASPTVNFALKTANRTIKGKIVDGSGSGIANAYINARPATFFGEGDFFGGGFGQSKGDGTFELKTVNGTYLVEAHVPGMPPAKPAEVTVQDNSSNTDNNTSADIYSNGTLVTGDGVTLKVAKGSLSISGKILDESGNGVAYAHVGGELLDSSGNPFGHWVDAPADTNGSYTLYVDAGTWRLRAFAPGFGDLGTITKTVDTSNLSGVNFQASSADFGTVSGIVFQDTNGNGSADSGEGISGAMLHIFGPSGGNGTGTNSDGTYSMKVKAGSGYILEGFAPGKGPLEPTAAFTVTADSTVTKNLSIAGTGTIQVTITGITDAFLDARTSNGRGFGTGANTNGVYSLTLPASTAGISYTVRANNPKYGDVGSSTVTLKTGETQTVTLTPPSLQTVSGTISSTNAACVAGISVYLSDPTNGRHAVVQSNESGAWSVSVPDGNYTLGAGKPGCIDSANPSIITVAGAAVSTGTNRTMTKSDTTISGRVLLNNANVKSPTVVIASNGKGKVVVTQVDTTVTGTSNNYTLDVTGGTWTVQARSDGSESTSVSVTVASAGSATQNLTLTPIAGYTVKEAKASTLKPSSGGIVKNNDLGDNFQLYIPAGALKDQGGTQASSNDATVTTKETTSVVDTNTADVLGNKGIDITPKDASGNKISYKAEESSTSAITITVPYTESDIPSGVTEDKLTLSVWSEDKQNWEALSTTVDTTNNTLTATVTHFSTFAPTAPVGGASAPSTPTGVTATALSKTSVRISWTQVSDTTGYNVYRDTSSSGTFPRVGSDPTVSSGETTSYDNDQLTCNTTYYYKVSSVNASGESSASSAVSVTTNACTTGGGGGGGGGGALSAPASAKEPQKEAEVVGATPAQQPTTPAAPVVLPPVSPAPGLVSFAEGTLVRAANAFKVFMVKAGKLLHIPNPTSFAALGLSWSNIQEVSPATVTSAPAITLQRAKGDFKVYTVRDGRKMHIPNPEAFAKAGHRWEDIVEVDKGFIQHTPDATLIRASDSPKVYKIEKGELRWITTLEVFNRMKLDWADVVVVGPTELYYPIGKDVM